VQGYGAAEYPVYFMGWMIWNRRSICDRGQRFSFLQKSRFLGPLFSI